MTRTAISPRLAMRTFTARIVSAAMRSHARPMTEQPIDGQRQDLLRGIVDSLLGDLKSGVGDKDRRRQVEEWLRTLAEKYPEFAIESGLRDYYLAEAERLRAEFDKSTELAEKLSLGRNVESFLDRASDYARRVADRKG